MAVGGQKNPRVILEDINGFFELLVMLGEYSIKKLIFTSSSAIYGAPQNPEMPMTEETPLKGSNMYAAGKVAGWVHRFILKKDLDVPEFPNPLSLSTEVGYYDGLGNKGSEWAYFTTGLSTKYALSKDISFVPGLYHQISMEDAVNTDDITYVQLSMRYVF